MKRNEYYVVWCDEEHEAYFLATNKLEAIDIFDKITRIYNKKHNQEYLTFFEIVNGLSKEEKCKTFEELFDEILYDTDVIHVCELVEFVDTVKSGHCDGYDFACSILIQDLYQQIKEEKTS